MLRRSVLIRCQYIFRTHFNYFILSRRCRNCDLYDIRISESCVDPNPLMVKRQDPDNLTRFQTRERCALEIAAVIKCRLIICILGDFSSICFHLLIVFKLTFSKLVMNTIRAKVSNTLDPNQERHSVGADLGPNCLQKVISRRQENKSKLVQSEPGDFLIF